MRELLYDAWDRLDRMDTFGFNGLSPRDQVFFCIWMLQAEVDNGGFCQYMFNSTGDHALEAVAALREVGADDLASICERFYELLPGGRPAADMRARQEQLDAAAPSMGDEAFESASSTLEKAFYAGEDDLRRRLVDYLQKKVGS